MPPTTNTDTGAGLRGLTVTLGRRDLGLLGLASVAVILIGSLVAARLLPWLRRRAVLAAQSLHLGARRDSRVAGSPGRSTWASWPAAPGLGGFLLMVSGFMRGRFRVAFAVVSVVAGVAGMMCGLFPMDYLATHRLVSSTFFLTGWLVAATFTFWLARPPAG